jgi:hypothetical protein
MSHYISTKVEFRHGNHAAHEMCPQQIYASFIVSKRIDKLYSENRNVKKILCTIIARLL